MDSERIGTISKGIKPNAWSESLCQATRLAIPTRGCGLRNPGRKGVKALKAGLIAPKIEAAEQFRAN
jgi:hypothetical protein